MSATGYTILGRWVVTWVHCDASGFNGSYFEMGGFIVFLFFFFFNDTATTEIYTLSLHDALPIWRASIFCLL